MEHIQGKVYSNSGDEMGTVEIKGNGAIALAWVWSESKEWLLEVKELVKETAMMPFKCESCTGYLLTLRPKATANFQKAFPIG
jgi:hypothetical protein